MFVSFVFLVKNQFIFYSVHLNFKTKLEKEKFEDLKMILPLLFDQEKQWIAKKKKKKKIKLQGVKFVVLCMIKHPDSI